MTVDKINQSNTWNFEIIESFSDLKHSSNDSTSINFVKVSNTLDSCVKVYTTRIDSLETDLRKLEESLLGSISKVVDEEAAGEGKGQGAAKLRKHAANTLDTNAALSIDSVQLNFAADPLFQKTAADFDEGGAKGLLLSHLSIQSNGKILFDASDSCPPSLADPKEFYSNQHEIDFDGFLAKFSSKFSNIDRYAICPTFSNFCFSGDAVQEFIFQGADQQDYYFNQLDELSDEEDLPEMNLQYNMQVNQDLGMNFDMGSIENNDMDVETPHTDLEDNSDDAPKQISNVMHRTSILKMGLEQPQNMFTYFDKVQGKNWAGPEFWKGRSLKSTSNPSQPKTVAKKKPKPTLNFLNCPVLDRKTVFAKSSTSISLPKSKQLKSDYLLPDDLQFNSDKLVRVFLKPRFTIQEITETIAGYHGEDNRNQLLESRKEEYNGDGFDDDDQDIEFPVFAQGFGILQGEMAEMEPALENRVSLSNNSIGEHNEGEIGNMADNSENAENSRNLNSSFSNRNADMINPLELKLDQNISFKPALHKPIPLMFARAAKRVDVAKLKENLWNRFSTPPSVETQKDSTISGKNFTSIVHELDDCYEEKQRKDISVAFCFICVLHLANENNLSIKSEGMKDLIISA